MELRHLKYFVAVAEELHFAHAAERLNITPPTLTHQIKALETMLGTKLLARKGNTAVALTQVGKDFLEGARATLKQAEQAQQIARRASRGEMGSITVGYILAAACSGAVASAIVEFKKSHPDVSFDLRKMETIPQMKALIDGTIDVGFLRQPRNYPTELTGFVVEMQSPWLAIPKNHHLAAHTTIEPEMLNGEKFVTTQVEMEVGFWAGITAIASPKMSMQIVARYPDVFSVLNGVAAGLGIGVIAEALTRLSIPGVLFRNLQVADKSIGHAVIFRKNERAPAIKAFVDMLRNNNKYALK